MTPCIHCKTKNIYRFTDTLCCWVRFFNGLPNLPDKDGLTTRDYWLALLRKAGKTPLANDIQRHLED